MHCSKRLASLPGLPSFYFARVSLGTRLVSALGCLILLVLLGPKNGVGAYSREHGYHANQRVHSLVSLFQGRPPISSRAHWSHNGRAAYTIQSGIRAHMHSGIVMEELHIQ